MNRPGPSSKNRTKPTAKRAPLSPKDRPSLKILRLLFTIVLAVVLAVVFIKMIMPDDEDRSVRPDTVRTITPQKTAEVELEAPTDGGTIAPDATEDVVRIYRGQGGEPVDDPILTWEITLEISGRVLRLLEGNVVAREFPGELPTSDFSFSIAPNRYLMNLTESETVPVRLDNTYDPLTAALFSINDNSQFFVYLTPKKLSLPLSALPSRFLNDRENSSLITMQGFIRADDTVIGTFHSIFVPSIEYILEPFAAE